MEQGNSSHQNSQSNFPSSQPSSQNSQFPQNSQVPQNSQFFQNSQFLPNFQFPPNFQFLQNSQFPQNAQLPGNVQFPSFSPIYQTSQFAGSSQFPTNIQSTQFPGNMQFTQFSPFSTQSENEVTITPPSSNSENRRQLWSIEDDKMLARAHTTISQDGRIGNEQKGITFWKRIEKYYNANHPNGGEKRTHQKLKTHWAHVKSKTMDFHTIYCKLQGMRPSGASDADIVVRALEEYKQKHGREKFGYEHVWAIVKDLPSWQPQFVARQISLNTSSTNQTSSGSVAGSASGSEEVFPRPIGKKASKRKAKERYPNNDNDDDHIHGSLQKQVELLERYQKMKLESDERKMKMKEYRVLTRDTSGMTEEQLALHIEYCNDIKQRRQNAQRP